MEIFYAKQSNGKWCRFSARCNTVTAWNLDLGDAPDIPQMPFGAVITNFLPTVDSVDTFNEKLRQMGSEIRVNPDFFKFKE